MKIFFTIILATNVLNFARSFQCEKDEKLCSESTQKSHLFQIRDWWTKVSVQKPIKCKEKFMDRKIRNEIWDQKYYSPIIKSVPCEPGEISTPYQIRGSGLKVIDGYLEGTGKILFISNWPLGSTQELLTQTCLRVFLGSIQHHPVEIIGTLKKGVLNDIGKIKFSDNSTKIASFEDGLEMGYYREWNPAGQLVKVGFSYREHRIGHCWYEDQGYLIYEDCSVFDRSKGLSKSFMMSSEFKNPITGHYRKSSNVLENVHEARITSLQGIGDCFLELDYKDEKAMNKNYSPIEKTFFPKTFSLDESICSDTLRENHFKSAPELLNIWINRTTDAARETPNKELFRLKQNDIPVQFDKAIVLLSEVKVTDNTSFSTNVTVMNGKPVLFNLNTFHLDEELRCHGFCHLSIADMNDLGRIGTDSTLAWSPYSIKGEFVHGVLQGLTNLLLNTGQFAEGFVVNGVLHGPFTILGITQILPGRKLRRDNNHRLSIGMGFIGTYGNGRADGEFWIGMKGNGYLHGTLNMENSSVTGNEIAYIYTDRETAFLGRFENKQMKHAQESTVMEVGCNSNGLMIVTKFQDPSGPYFYYDPPTNESFGAGPPGVRDPFEKKWLELKKSNILSAGEGVFVKRDVPNEFHISLYSGHLYDHPVESSLYLARCTENTSLSDDHRRACKKYSLGISSFNTTIDIPPELDTPETFHPTLGPKVNHHFRLNNTAYLEFEHPRWGTIMSVWTTKELKAGEELFAYYGYKNSIFPGDFLWYFEEKLRIDREERLEKDEAEEKKKLMSKKRKTKKKLINSSAELINK